MFSNVLNIFQCYKLDLKCSTIKLSVNQLTCTLFEPGSKETHNLFALSYVLYTNLVYNIYKRIS